MALNPPFQPSHTAILPPRPTETARLTRTDRAFYWLYWLSGHASGIVPYDWNSDWRLYLALRATGLSPWKAFTAEFCSVCGRIEPCDQWHRLKGSVNG